MNIINFLEDVLGIQGKLAPTGWYRACCPIHGEQSPSFAVNSQYPYVYNCLACGAHGHIAYLVKEIKGISLPRAIELVQEHLAIDLADVERLLFTPKNDNPYVDNAVIKAFKDTLDKSPGLRYCRGRGIPRYVLEQFNVGYEPLAARLIVPFYALPSLSRAVGFDTRELDVDADVRKSVDVASGWRTKSVLFPVNVKNTWRGVIPVEGFFDAARVFRWLAEERLLGEYLPAAICGNKVSRHHASFFSSFDNICLGFDNDKGGNIASLKLQDWLPERVFKQLRYEGNDPGQADTFIIEAKI